MSLKGKGDSVDTSSCGNRLIDSLPPEQREGVLAQCKRVELASGTVLCEVGESWEYVYFPLAGSISLARSFLGRSSIETGSVGSEGMLGAILVLNINRAIQRGVVQTPCLALCINATRVPAVLKRYPALLCILQRYLYVVIEELLQATACIHFHDVGRRLARGLLVAHDRDRVDQLHLTHQRLSEMLGVQRGAVTLAASKLQKDGVIFYRRGKIFILDRTRLEALSCQCYQVGLDNYANILSCSTETLSKQGNSR